MIRTVIILCAVLPIDTETVAALPCAVVSMFEGPAATVDVDAEIEVVETTGEVVS